MALLFGSGVIYLVSIGVFQPHLLANNVNGGASYLVSAWLENPGSFLATRDDFGYLPLFTNLFYQVVFYFPASHWPLLLNVAALLLIFSCCHVILHPHFRHLIASDSLRLLLASWSSIVLCSWDVREPNNAPIALSVPLLVIGLTQFSTQETFRPVPRKPSWLALPLISISKPLVIALWPVFALGVLVCKGRRLLNLSVLASFAISLFLATQVLSGEDSRLSDIPALIGATILIFFKVASFPILDLARLFIDLQGAEYAVGLALVGGSITFVGNYLLAVSRTFSKSLKISIALLELVVFSNIFAVAATYGYLWNASNLDKLVIYPNRHSFIIFFAVTLGIALLASHWIKDVPLAVALVGLLILVPAHFLQPLRLLSPLTINPNASDHFDTRWLGLYRGVIEGTSACVPASPFPNFVGARCTGLLVQIDQLEENLEELAKLGVETEFIIIHSNNSITETVVYKTCENEQSQEVEVRDMSFGNAYFESCDVKVGDLERRFGAGTQVLILFGEGLQGAGSSY